MSAQITRAQSPRHRWQVWLGLGLMGIFVFQEAALALAAPPAGQQPLTPDCLTATALPGTAVTLVDLPNGDFEAPGEPGAPQDWNVFPPSPQPSQAEAGLEEQPVHSGHASLRIASQAGDSVVVRSHTLPTWPRVKHVVSVYVWSEAGPGQLILEFWDLAGQRVGQATAQSQQTGVWEPVQVEAVSPGNAVAVSVALKAAPATPSVAFFDDVFLTRAAKGVWPMPTQKYMMSDTSLLEAAENVAWVEHQAAKCSQPIFVADTPWETGDGSLEYNLYIYSILYDEDEQIYKMWYGRGFRLPAGRTADADTALVSLYATSRDGLHWDKPTLGLYNYQGSTANNVLGALGLGSVIKDEAEADPARRYKALAGNGQGYIVFFSPDGLHWSSYDNGRPVIPVQDGDSGSAFYDPYGDQFVALVKVYIQRGGLQRRAFAISYSQDFINWTPPKVVLASDARDDDIARGQQFAFADIYGVGLFPYEGAYVSFPVVFQQIGLPGQPGANDGPFDVEIAFSSDLENWQRENRNPVLPRGIAGSFDSGLILPAHSPLLVGNQIWYYYIGLNGLHLTRPRTAMGGIAVWRLDGFASLANGGQNPGLVTTQPITVTGGLLTVNAEITGSLRAEVLDEQNNVIPGFSVEDSVPLTGDGVALRLRWRKHPDLQPLLGRTVKLRFYLQGGDLYSFQVQFAPGQVSPGR